MIVSECDTHRTGLVIIEATVELATKSTRKSVMQQMGQLDGSHHRKGKVGGYRRVGGCG